MLHFRLLPCFFFAFLVILPGKAQEILVLQPGPSDGKDAFLDSREYFRNFGDHVDLAAMAWTNEGRPVTVRGLIQFDLSQLPKNARLIDARLSLYSYYSPRNRAHSTRNGPNRSSLRLVNEPWVESTVTWETQPSLVPFKKIILETSDQEVQDYTDIDVLPLIREMHEKPNAFFGFMLMLEVEERYRSMLFASSDHPDPSLRPKLEIRYWKDTHIDTCVLLRPDAFAGRDAYIESRESSRNFGGHEDLAAMAWTNQGRDVTVRGLLDFDLDQIPECARILSADLSLYSFLSPRNGSHSDRNGSNSAYLKRIVDPWREYEVTWNSQPATTELNQVVLEGTSDPIRHYENINVTTLVQDMVRDPQKGHGFMLHLQTEAKYRSLVFASSDHPDRNLHPALSICYSDVRIDEEDCGGSGGCKITVYPNPSWFETNIALENCSTVSECKVYDILGRFLFSLPIGSHPIIPVDITDLTGGIYFLTFFNGQDMVRTIKFIKSEGY